MNNQTKILLISPPQKFYGDSLGFNVYFPLSLLNIAAMVKDLCHVKILDCLIEDFEIKKGNNWTLYGTPYPKLKEIIKKEAPDIVGITIPFSSQSESAKKVGIICREIDPNITVVMGGPHVAVGYEALLHEEICDFCIVREGEITFREFIRKMISNEKIHGLKGLAYKKNHKIIYEPREDLIELDNLPFPAYELLDHNKYLQSPYLYKSRSGIAANSISMITSRGCPYKCTFCSIAKHMGRKYRYHSSVYVIEHIRYCVEKMGVNNFHFEDDNISLIKKRFGEIIDKIIGNNLDISWDTPNGVRAETLDYNLLKKAKKSGCNSLQIAIESGNQDVLNNIIKKNSSLKAIEKVTGFCNNLKIPLRAFYVIGFPGETMENIYDTINLALKLFKVENVFPILLFATPLYGTELYNECVEKKLIDQIFSDEELSQATQFYGNPLISTNEFSKDDLKKIGRYFEEEMNRIISDGTYRQVLTNKRALFANGKH